MEFITANEEHIRNRKTWKVIELNVLYPSDITAEMLGFTKNIPVRLSQCIADWSMMWFRLKNQRKNYFLGKDILNYRIPKIIDSVRDKVKKP